MKREIRKVTLQLDDNRRGIYLVDDHRVFHNVTRTSLWRLQNLLGDPTDTWATIIIGDANIRLTWRIFAEDKS